MSDSPPPPSLGQLLSAEVTLLHETRRSYMAKRVVKSEGKGYVLYCVPQRERMLRFETALRQAAAAGVRMQGLVHESHVADASGNWLALRFAHGEPLGRSRPGPRVYQSLGRMLARLHSQESDHAVSLLRGRTDATEYARVLDRVDLSGDERRWVGQSAERLYRIGRFQLAHGDLHRQNILVSPNEQISLIDYELFAFEPAGLELAMVLLREYCRRPENRQLLLNNYLATSREGIRELWQEFYADLLFAAALRLAAQRDARTRVLQRQLYLLSARKMFGILAGEDAASLLEAKRELWEGAGARMLAYDEMAIRLVRHACENPQASAQALLAVAHGA